ncbi:hypothetical protein CJP74_04290 [Psittacicella melopsittaci]|uniref:Uncharacterized protein n=1 Tax=Psittacicella melopsittaci TaxID=2028576 RepID=A0A3A1Y2J8_9GAMM|nr:hypothetical protein [Psittacicella melopsittaci]RIY32542.1 hypothetical protein CJP74_04290 [Psittacicella melopsittaci]
MKYFLIFTLLANFTWMQAQAEEKSTFSSNPAVYTQAPTFKPMVNSTLEKVIDLSTNKQKIYGAMYRSNATCILVIKVNDQPMPMRTYNLGSLLVKAPSYLAPQEINQMLTAFARSERIGNN